jgi:predicted permease
MLVRAEARQHEFAIRHALGAKRSRVARGLLMESLLLATIGGVFGLALAYGGLRLLVFLEPANLPRLADIAIDPATVFFTIAITLACGLGFGLIPIVKYAGRRSPAAGIGARGASLGRAQQRSQNVLVMAQIALAMVLLVSSGLMIRSFQALRAVAPGFTEPRTLQTFTFTIPPEVVPGLDAVSRTQQNILDRIRSIAGVSSAAFTTRLPMDPDDRWSAAISAEGIPDAGKTPPNHQVKVISPGMFQTMGTPIVAGRDFTWTDLDELRETAMVSENLARELWGSPQAAIGKRIRQYYGAKGPWREIVGVAADVHDDGVHQPAPLTVYWPGRLDAKVFAGYQPRRVSVIIRTPRAGSPSLLDELRHAVGSVNRSLPLAQARTLDVLHRRSMSRTSFTLTLLAIAATLALVLGMCGVYGVIAYAVSQRRREIGIRIALGAQATAIRGLFLKRGVIVAAAGVVVGLGAAVALARWMQSILFGVTPFDPLTFAVMPAVLAGSAVVATYLPARRALLVDPIETIRAE